MEESKGKNVPGGGIICAEAGKAWCCQEMQRTLEHKQGGGGGRPAMGGGGGQWLGHSRSLDSILREMVSGRVMSRCAS